VSGYTLFPPELLNDDRVRRLPGGAGGKAWGVYTALWVYSGGNRDDGFVRARIARQYAGSGSQALRQLVESGLLGEAKEGDEVPVNGRVRGLPLVMVVAPEDGYIVLDYLVHNKTAEEERPGQKQRVDAGRASARKRAEEAKRKQAERQVRREAEQDTPEDPAPDPSTDQAAPNDAPDEQTSHSGSTGRSTGTPPSSQVRSGETPELQQQHLLVRTGADAPEEREPEEPEPAARPYWVATDETDLLASSDRLLALIEANPGTPKDSTNEQEATVAAEVAAWPGATVPETLTDDPGDSPPALVPIPEAARTAAEGPTDPADDPTPKTRRRRVRRPPEGQEALFSGDATDPDAARGGTP
jgi:hypothetical protein